MKLLRQIVAVLALTGLLLAQTKTGGGGSAPATRGATVSVSGQVANINTATLFTPAVAGEYRVNYYMPSTVVCVTPGPAQVVLTLGWTDDVGARTTTATLVLGATSTAPQSGSVVVWSTASAISYSTAYTACTSGTGTYSLRVTVEQLQ